MNATLLASLHYTIGPIYTSPRDWRGAADGILRRTKLREHTPLGEASYEWLPIASAGWLSILANELTSLSPDSPPDDSLCTPSRQPDCAFRQMAMRGDPPCARLGCPASPVINRADRPEILGSTADDELCIVRRQWYPTARNVVASLCFQSLS
jgi:hypothetical protein